MATTTSRGVKENAAAAVDAATQLAGQNSAVANTLQKLRPILVALGAALDAAFPIVEKAYSVGKKLWVKAGPYHPDLYLQLILGILLVFFGGQFPVLVAAVEAFRLVGWAHTKRAVTLLWHQYHLAKDASAKDDMVDSNYDGVADVQQITAQQLATRKLQVFLKATDPAMVREGLEGVTAGMTAVVAALRMQFAQTLALGASLGDVFEQASSTVLRPALEKLLPREYYKWIDTGIVYVCRTIACTIAWWCQRVISAMHSATRGGQLVLTAVGKLLAAYRINVPFVNPDMFKQGSPAFAPACGAMCGMGMYTQIMRGFSLPFPFNIILLPLHILEWLLWFLLASKE